MRFSFPSFILRCANSRTGLVMSAITNSNTSGLKSMARAAVTGGAYHV